MQAVEWAKRLHCCSPKHNDIHLANVASALTIDVSTVNASTQVEHHKTARSKNPFNLHAIADGRLGPTGKTDSHATLPKKESG